MTTQNSQGMYKTLDQETAQTFIKEGQTSDEKVEEFLRKRLSHI